MEESGDRVPMNGCRACDWSFNSEKKMFRSLKIGSLVVIFAFLPFVSASDFGGLEPTNGLSGPLEQENFHAEVRCYCNLPACVSTGYMCKSSLGTCYTDMIDQTDTSKSRHGCLELAASPSLSSCRQEAEEDEKSGLEAGTLYCCPEDMCNYVDSLTRRQQNETNSKNHLYKNAALEHLGVNVGVLTSLVNAQSPQHSRAEVWLKAATIAVPIAGGCILVLLIVLAVRMLKRDRRIAELPQHKDSHSVFQRVLSAKGTEYALCPARAPHTVPVQKKFDCNRRCQSLQSFGQSYNIYQPQYKRPYQPANVTLLRENFCDKSSLISNNLSPTVVVFGGASPGRSRHFGMTV